MRISPACLIVAFLPLCACQSGGLGGAQFQTTAAEQNAMFARGGPPAKEMSDKERSDLLATAAEIQAEAPALTAAGTFGGLDPTGTAQSLVWAEQMRQAQKIQAHMPAMMADTRYRAEAYCKANPRLPDCVELKRMQAELARQKR